MGIIRKHILNFLGVQSGLNYFMDLIKFALVIGLPNDDTFGYLIIASFAFVLIGAVFYSAYMFNPAKVASAAEIANQHTNIPETGQDNPVFDNTQPDTESVRRETEATQK